jgi:hypothetical protein
MNAKLTILILVAMIAAVLVPVSAENVYVDRNPALYDVLPPDAYGYVVFYIRAGGSAQDLNIWIGNDAKNATFDPTYHPDRTPIEGQNPDFLKVKVLPDGVSEPVMLAAGNYTAYLQKGNGDQLEQFKFVIDGGATERVPFLGSAVSNVGERVCIPVYKIIEATYGSGGCWEVVIIDVPAWDETVVDKEPWTEYIYHPEVNHTVHHEAITETIYHPEVNHTIHHAAIPGTPAWTEYFGDYAVHDSHYNYVGTDLADYDITFKDVGNWHGDYSKSGSHYTYAGHDLGKYDVNTVVNAGHITHPAIPEVPAWDEIVVDVPAYEEVVVVTPAYDEIVVDSPAYTETIQHPAETHIVHHPAITHTEKRCNEIVDVTSAVQSVVNGGNNQFLFDNRPAEGGIFAPDGTTLLYVIVDPAPGFVKAVTISYTDGCGNDKIIHASEYDVIDLTAGGATTLA